MDQVVAQLASCGLEQYADAFEVAGFDSLPELLSLTADDTLSLVEAVGIPVGHELRFRRGFRLPPRAPSGAAGGVAGALDRVARQRAAHDQELITQLRQEAGASAEAEAEASASAERAWAQVDALKARLSACGVLLEAEWRTLAAERAQSAKDRAAAERALSAKDRAAAAAQKKGDASAPKGQAGSDDTRLLLDEAQSTLTSWYIQRVAVFLSRRARSGAQLGPPSIAEVSKRVPWPAGCGLKSLRAILESESCGAHFSIRRVASPDGKRTKANDGKLDVVSLTAEGERAYANAKAGGTTTRALATRLIQRSNWGAPGSGVGPATRGAVKVAMFVPAKGYAVPLAEFAIPAELAAPMRSARTVDGNAMFVHAATLLRREFGPPPMGEAMRRLHVTDPDGLRRLLSYALWVEGKPRLLSNRRPLDRTPRPAK